MTADGRNPGFWRCGSRLVVSVTWSGRHVAALAQHLAVHLHPDALRGSRDVST